MTSQPNINWGARIPQASAYPSTHLTCALINYLQSPIIKEWPSSSLANPLRPPPSPLPNLFQGKADDPCDSGWHHLQKKNPANGLSAILSTYGSQTVPANSHPRMKAHPAFTISEVRFTIFTRSQNEGTSIKCSIKAIAEAFNAARPPQASCNDRIYQSGGRIAVDWKVACGEEYVVPSMGWRFTVDPIAAAGRLGFDVNGNVLPAEEYLKKILVLIL